MSVSGRFGSSVARMNLTTLTVVPPIRRALFFSTESAPIHLRNMRFGALSRDCRDLINAASSGVAMWLEELKYPALGQASALA